MRFFRFILLLVIISVSAGYGVFAQQETLVIQFMNGDTMAINTGSISNVGFSETSPPPTVWMHFYMNNGDTIDIDGNTVDSTWFYVVFQEPVYSPYVANLGLWNVDGTSVEIGSSIWSNPLSEATHRGFVYGTDTMPTTLNDSVLVGSGNGPFQTTITGLQPNSPYHFRAYGINGVGITYSSQLSTMAVNPLFTVGGGVTDIDGNNYRTAVIGNQEWMAQNLATTTFRDGVEITHAANQATWNVVNLYEGKYCHVNNTASNLDDYGLLYKWNTAKSTHGICPTGWHLPNNWEWQLLVEELGGPILAGIRMKEPFNNHWDGPNVGATNQSGFTGVATGIREYNDCVGFGTFSSWWTPTARTYQLNTNDSAITGVQMNGNYGSCVRCLKNTPPIVSTTGIGYSYPGAISGYGRVRSEGGSPMLERGVCYALHPNPTIADSYVAATTPLDTGWYPITIWGVDSLTTYYIRSYATNALGINYGEELSATTVPYLPIIYTQPNPVVTDTSAICEANLVSNGGGTITERGICVAGNPQFTGAEVCFTSNPSSTPGIWSDTIVSSGNLNVFANFTYYYYAYATNNTGTIYGDTLSFTTNNAIPTCYTYEVENVSTFECTFRGNANGNGLLYIDRGICYSTSPNPTVTDSVLSLGPGPGGIGYSSFFGNVYNLLPGTTYYVRAYAENALGVGYGIERVFTSNTGGVWGNGVTDIEGNEYRTVIIAGREWMAENLRTAHYSTGTALEYAPDSADWDNAGWLPGAYTWLDMDSAQHNVRYGKLYSGAVVMSSEEVCPLGWHMPTPTEWDYMIGVLGGGFDATIKMKDTGFLYWGSGNEDATNESGFAGLPGGFINPYGGFEMNNGFEGTWWSTTSGGSLQAYSLWHASGNIQSWAYNSAHGFSIRCIKD
jgi:uncharacterized protein (TIGR02145 family)